MVYPRADEVGGSDEFNARVGLGLRAAAAPPNRYPQQSERYDPPLFG